MPIPKIKETKQKTEQAIQLKRELERQEQQRIERQLEEQARKKEAEERDRLNAAKRAAIQKARLVRQKNILFKKLLDAAASGSYLLPIGNLPPSLEKILEESGFKIQTVREDLDIIGEGLKQQWGITPPSMTKLKELFNELRKFIMISIVRGRYSKPNSREEIYRLASILLTRYEKDLENDDVRSFHKRIYRLHELDSDDRHAEILMSDLFSNRQEYLDAKKNITQDILDIAINVDDEQEFFSIIETILDELESEVRQLDRAVTVCESVTDALVGLEEDSRTISWWSNYYFIGQRPDSFAKELFWLSSPHGQVFLHQLEERIEDKAESGESCLTVGLVWGYGETFLISILKKYLSSQGYEVEFTGVKHADMSMTIKW